MYFSHAFRKTLLAAPTTPGGATLLVATSNTTGTTSALTSSQLGIFDRNYASIAYAGAGTTAPFYIVQGSYFKTTGYSDAIGAQGGYQESVKSKLINPKYISRIFWVQAKAPVQQVVQIPLTPASGSTNVGLNADTTYRLRLDVKGSPALRYLSHNLYRVMDTYTGPANATNPTYFKDPVATLVDWKEQINSSPYFNQLVQARAYTKISTLTVSSIGTPTTTSSVFTLTTTTNAGGIAIGQRIIGLTGTGLPANSFITALASTATATAGAGGTTTTSTYVVASGNTLSATGVVGYAITGAGFPVGAYISAYTSTTAYTITFPTQLVAPTISGVFTASATFTVTYPTQATAPTLGTGTFKTYNDLYGANGGSTVGFVNNVITGSVIPTYVGQATYIPGTLAYPTAGLAQTSVATNATVAAAATTLTATSGAHIYTAAPDASTFTSTDAFLELTAGYLETKFGAPTWTVSDNYDVEPLKIIASMMDDSGTTTMTTPIGTAALQTQGVAGIATEVQTAAQAQGTGEMVLRELILTGKYRQEAFGDGTNIDQFRIREIEANPGVLNMLTVASRNTLYNKLCILHNVPRFNNPSGVFDNDQYLIEIAVPNTVPITQFFSAATYTAGGTLTASGTAFGDYILESSIAAGGVQYAEMI